MLENLDSKTRNEAVREYCLEYIKGDISPKFAMLLDGEWGCGKTHFIQSIMEDTEITAYKFLYVSLFGINDTSEIGEKLFEAFHPVLSSKGMKLAATILKTTIDFVGTTSYLKKLPKVTKEIYSSLDFQDYKSLFNKKDDKTILEENLKYVLIIDDIERANIPPINILGYFSPFVSDSGNKVIFIGNQREISENKKISTNDKGNNEKKSNVKVFEKSDWSRIKEKVIGVEFKISPDYETAIDCFFTELGFDTYENAADIKDIIKNVSKSFEIYNLRVVRQTLYGLYHFINDIDVFLEDRHKKTAIIFFCVLYLQHCLGIIVTEEELNKAITVYNNFSVTLETYNNFKEEDKKETEGKFGFIPFYELWSEIILDNYVDKKKLQENYESIMKVSKDAGTQKVDDLFLLLGNWKNMKDAEFVETVNRLKDKVSCLKEIHPGYLIMYYNLVFIFQEWGLLDDDTSFFNVAEEFLNESQDKRILPISDWGMLDFTFGGYGYSDIDGLSEKKLKIKEISLRNVTIEQKRSLRELVENLNNENVEAFCSEIQHHNGTMSYYRFPVLSNLDIQMFFEKLKKLSLDAQERIESAFAERYGIVYANTPFQSEYIADFDNLKLLANFYKSISSGSVAFSPEKVRLKYLAEEYEKLVKYFEEKR